jgi:dipeptidyl aminopeptidase/acylaminoacyl peptidase
MLKYRMPMAFALSALAFTTGTRAQDATPPAPVAATTPPPVEVFAKLPFISRPTLSPDGKLIATQVAINGQLKLAIVPIDDVSKTKLINLGAFDLNGWTWVNNDWLVVRIGEMQPVEGDHWYVRRALAVNADGAQARALANANTGQNADDIIWKARDGSPYVMLAMQTSIYSNQPGFWPEVRKFDVSTGKSVRVQSSTSDVMDWYADTGGTVRLGIAYDDARQSLRALYRDRPDATLKTIDRARGPSAELATLPSLLVPQSNSSIAVDDVDGYDSVYDFDLTTMKIGSKTFGVPGYDIDGTVVDPTGTRLLGIRYTDTRPRTHWIDSKLAEIQGAIDKSIGNRQAQIVSWNDDMTILVVYVGTPDLPGTYYIFRTAEGRMSRFAPINDALAKRSLSSVQTITYKARDGVDISAVLILPKGRDPKKLPLILMPHGGPFARDDEEWDWWTQFMVSRGYAVLQPNYRGSSGFGTKFGEKGRGQWGLAMQDDLTDAVKWAADQGIADPARVCIVGASYGGYAALRAAQRDKGVYRCAVSFAGVSDLGAMLRYNSSFLNSGRSNTWLKAQAPDLKGVSPINYAADFSIPLLIMHGKADQTVPVKQSREMVEKLKAAGRDYRYVEQPLGDHHFTREADRLQFLQELEAFLTKYNPS